MRGGHSCDKVRNVAERRNAGDIMYTIHVHHDADCARLGCTTTTVTYATTPRPRPTAAYVMIALVGVASLALLLASLYSFVAV